LVRRSVRGEHFSERKKRLLFGERFLATKNQTSKLSLGKDRFLGAAVRKRLRRFTLSKKGDEGLRVGKGT